MPRKAEKITGKVWRFIDYEVRWGSNCDGLPKYLKWYINGWDGVDGEVLAALNQLRAEKDFVWLQGAWIELLNRATNTQEQYQGYLLNSGKCPATSSEIGSMLRVDGRKALAALMKLSKVGILEPVPCDEVEFFDCEPDNKTPLKKPKRTSGKKTKGGGGRKRAANGPKTGDPPLKGQEESAPKVPSKKEKEEKDKLPTPHSGGAKAVSISHAERVRNQFAEMVKEEEKKRAQTKMVEELESAMLQSSPLAELPTNADVGGVDTGSRSGRPHAASEGSGRHVIPFYPDAPHKYDPLAMSLSEWVVDEAIRYKGDDRHREVGTFAVIWHRHSSWLYDEAITKIKKHVYSKASAVRSGSKPTKWLSTVLKNKCSEVKRKHKSKTGACAG